MTDIEKIKQDIIDHFVIREDHIPEFIRDGMEMLDKIELRIKQKEREHIREELLEKIKEKENMVSGIGPLDVPHPHAIKESKEIFMEMAKIMRIIINQVCQAGKGEYRISPESIRKQDRAGASQGKGKELPAETNSHERCSGRPLKLVRKNPEMCKKYPILMRVTEEEQRLIMNGRGGWIILKEAKKV